MLDVCARCTHIIIKYTVFLGGKWFLHLQNYSQQLLLCVSFSKCMSVGSYYIMVLEFSCICTFILPTLRGMRQEATHTWLRTQGCSHTHFHINISFPSLFLHAFLLVSAAYITWTRWQTTMRAGESQLLPYCMPTSMHNFNNRTCHWHKSQSSSVSGPGYAHSNFIPPEQKIGAQGINLWSIPNILPTIQAALGGWLYISMGAGWQFVLRCIALRPKEWPNWPQSTVTKNKSNRTLQFHGDTARRNEMTVWLPSCLHRESSVRFSVCKDTHVKQLSKSLRCWNVSFFHMKWLLSMMDTCFSFPPIRLLEVELMTAA